ncbi:MAG: phosphopantothenoylcysteine decarboxylase [Spirochaetia bacterium]|nr:phosphopantothenoylcysteine decarboxylase [Spirochaetia bacterium]
MTTIPEKTIVIAVTGSIAAYKACDLSRSLTKKGHVVQVLMTEHAERFVGRATFQAITSREVFGGDWDEKMLHIDLKRMAGVFAVVPATANVLAKFAAGIADDLVTSSYLAMTCPVLCAPAMNPSMYSHPATQRNIAQLKKDGVIFVDPAEGEVVCGDTGQGKMADIALIEKLILESLVRGKGNA